MKILNNKNRFKKGVIYLDAARESRLRYEGMTENGSYIFSNIVNKLGYSSITKEEVLESGFDGSDNLDGKELIPFSIATDFIEESKYKVGS